MTNCILAIEVHPTCATIYFSRSPTAGDVAAAIRLYERFPGAGRTLRIAGLGTTPATTDGEARGPARLRALDSPWEVRGAPGHLRYASVTRSP